MAIIHTAASGERRAARNWRGSTAPGLSLDPRPSTLDPSPRGFALLIAVIFMSVMLAIGIALGSLAYKQQILASYATQSQYAFYAADAALECALYADQQQYLFAYPPAGDPGVAPVMTCDGFQDPAPTETWSTTQWVVKTRLSLDSNSRCADVTVYKPNPNSAGIVYIFSQGYDAPCGSISPRIVSRGINIHYPTGP